MDRKYNLLTEECGGPGDVLADKFGQLDQTEVAMIQNKQDKRYTYVRNVYLLVIAMFVVTMSVLLYLGSTGQLTLGHDDTLKYQLPVKGESGVIQHVHSSVSENYVEYYIEISDSEKTWILDDFNTDLQVIRNVVEGSSICYVSVLNSSEAMAPVSEQPEFIPYKDHTHGVYSPDEEPTEDRSFLGSLALQLCADSNLYWLRPMEVTEVTELPSNSSIHFNDELESHQESQVGGHHRNKRNISRCKTSCCWNVCCCNTRRFTWESSEFFTCRHICNKCTKAYKQKIQKLC